VALTPEVIQEIVTTYRQTRSPFKTARKVGVEVDDVFSVINDHQDKITETQERNGGLGREELQPFTVARRRASERGWNNNLEEIVQARKQYEAGTHIMATGRDGSWLILYSIPRKGRPDPQPGYFLPEVA
jgi:hypothetical protein